MIIHRWQHSCKISSKIIPVYGIVLISTKHIVALLSARESDPCSQSGQEEAGTVTELLLQLWCCHALTLLDEVTQNGLTNTPRALHRDKDTSDHATT